MMRTIYSKSGKGRTPKRNLAPLSSSYTHHTNGEGEVICRCSGKFWFSSAFSTAKQLLPKGSGGRVRLKLGSTELVITEKTSVTEAFKAFGGTGDPYNTVINR